MSKTSCASCGARLIVNEDRTVSVEGEQERDALAAQVAMARWFVEGFRQWWTEVRNRRMDAGPLDFDVEIATDTIERCDLFLANTAQAATEYRERIVREAVAQERAVAKKLIKSALESESYFEREAQRMRELVAVHHPPEINEGQASCFLCDAATHLAPEKFHRKEARGD